MTPELSRRQVLKLLSFLSAGTAAVGSVPFVSRFFADRANAQTGTVYVRENIFTFAQSSQKIAALRRGIQVMQSRPASNPLSWIYQANMHSTNDSPLRTAWRTCNHRNFFFFPWHRMYLYYFERILRQASGDSNLALPYWNYSDVVAQRVLPEPFRNPANSSTNPLYVSQRASNINQGSALPASAVSYTEAFKLTNFFHTTTNGESFGGHSVSQACHQNCPEAGELEKVPHNQVHIAVGGTDGWMRRVELAARDPIFWLHHANIDRLWERWLQQGGGRANPTNNSDWMDDTFTFFDVRINSNGSPVAAQVTMRGRDVLDTAAQLNHIYDDSSSRRTSVFTPSSPSTNTSTPEEVAMSASNQQLIIVLTNVPLTLTAPSQDLLRTTALSAESSLTLNVTGVEYNPASSIPYEIYINLPQGMTPDPYGPYFAGYLALFAFPQRGTFSLKITEVVRELQRLNLMSGDFISVTFVPPSQEIPRNIVTQGSANQLRGAVRISGVTLTRR